MDILLRSTPTLSNQDTVRVNRHDNIIYGLSTFQSFVEALGHGMMGDDITMSQLTELGNSTPHGIKARLTHPGLSEDGTGKMVARMRNFRVEDDKVLADAHMLSSARKSPVYHHDVVEYLMNFAEESPEHMGMSIVAAGRRVNLDQNGNEWDSRKDVPDGIEFTNEMPILRVDELRAADFVDEPAANRDGMFRALNAGTTNILSSDMFQYLDLFFKEQGIPLDKAEIFCKKYFHARLKMGRKPVLPYARVLDQLL